VDSPECEDLAMGWNVDAYRQFTGPAILAGKRIISAEVGAALAATYQTQLPGLLNGFKRLFAGGVNSLSIHGLSYSGSVCIEYYPAFHNAIPDICIVP
jgi:hypothetical protein